MITNSANTNISVSGTILDADIAQHILYMSQESVISGTTEEEVWQQIVAQFQADPEPLEYTAIIEQGSQRITLDIDIDLGGGFESGYETTTFTAPLHSLPTFKFAIHAKHFTDEIGKFFGMQDVVIGFDEFDDKFIIKTNDAARVKELFSDAGVRTALLQLDDFTFGITMHHVKHGDDHKNPFLELLIETGVTDVQKLREIYTAFYTVLLATDTSA